MARLLHGDEEIGSRHVAVVSLIGSRAYGLAHADSDADYRGVYVADLETVLGLEEPAPEIIRHDPDFTVFEIGKFTRLAMAANPNVLEILWGPVLHESDLGRMLLERRHLFLTRRARAAYLGFAMNQLKKVERYERLGREAKREKSARHLFRLFAQAEQVLRHGEVELQVSEPDELRALSRLPLTEIQDYFSLLDDWLKHMPSDLPERADFKAISRLVRDIRMVAVHEAQRQ